MLLNLLLIPNKNIAQFITKECGDFINCYIKLKMKLIKLITIPNTKYTLCMTSQKTTKVLHLLNHILATKTSYQTQIYMKQRYNGAMCGVWWRQGRDAKENPGPRSPTQGVRQRRL